MKWKFKDWGDKYADVTINFDEDEDEVSQRTGSKCYENSIIKTYLFQLNSRIFLISNCL